MAAGPIVRQRQYSHAEVETILRASEHRSGHSYERHVGIPSNRPSLQDPDGMTLAMRSDQAMANAANGGIVDPRTAFNDNASQFMAVTEGLNSTIGQRALGELDRNPMGTRVSIEAPLVTEIDIRYGSAGIVRSARASIVRIVCESVADDATYGLHIVTAFPCLYYRVNAGQPAYQVGRGAWIV